MSDPEVRNLLRRQLLTNLTKSEQQAANNHDRLREILEEMRKVASIILWNWPAAEERWATEKKLNPGLAIAARRDAQRALRRFGYREVTTTTGQAAFQQLPTIGSREGEVPDDDDQTRRAPQEAYQALVRHRKLTRSPLRLPKNATAGGETKGKTCPPGSIGGKRLARAMTRRLIATLARADEESNNNNDDDDNNSHPSTAMTDEERKHLELVSRCTTLDQLEAAHYILARYERICRYVEELSQFGHRKLQSRKSAELKQVQKDTKEALAKHRKARLRGSGKHTVIDPSPLQDMEPLWATQQDAPAAAAAAVPAALAASAAAAAAAAPAASAVAAAVGSAQPSGEERKVRLYAVIIKFHIRKMRILESADVYEPVRKGVLNTTEVFELVRLGIPTSTILKLANVMIRELLRKVLRDISAEVAQFLASNPREVGGWVKWYLGAACVRLERGGGAGGPRCQHRPVQG